MFLLGVAQVTEPSCRALEGLCPGGDTGQPCPLLRVVQSWAVLLQRELRAAVCRNATAVGYLQELQGCWEGHK